MDYEREIECLTLLLDAQKLKVKRLLSLLEAERQSKEYYMLRCELLDE